MDMLIERLEHIPTATVCDAYAKLKIRPLERVVMRGLQPIVPLQQRVVGRARTQQLVSLRNPQEGSLIADRALHFEIVDGAQPGDVIVVAVAGSDKLASWGDVLALKAHAQGVAAVVVDGAVRDASVIAEIGLPVWSDGVTPIPQGYGGYSVQSVNESVTCAGVEVRPGDLIVADADGVVVIPASELEDILPICEEFEEQERRARDGIAAGKALKDLYPSRAYYNENAGVKAEA
jgi:5-oxopent-3-ene-1,2,5-tricarboxylate decarboxylase / 2-hydroxyhepta-2,4-diene-1,7-dioate isomerase